MVSNYNRIKIILVKQGKKGKWLDEHFGNPPVIISKWHENATQPHLIISNEIATY